jgi:glycosyltransferase involved in cell wall biosynthesis
MNERGLSREFPTTISRSCTAVNTAVESVSAFFPCYNDERTIGRMVETAGDSLDNVGVGAEAEIIVVNDGSSDESEVVLKHLTEIEPRLLVVTHEHNRGYGGALLSGFGSATKQWVFYTDGDGQYDPAELEVLVAKADDDVDVVQGYKLNRADSVARRAIGRVYHRFVSLAFGLQVRDTDCDFRLMRRSLLDRVQLQKTTGVICVELVRTLQDAGARFIEVGVHHYPRPHGKSQFFKPSNVVRTLWDLAKLWIQLVVLRRGARCAPAPSWD